MSIKYWPQYRGMDCVYYGLKESMSIKNPKCSLTGIKKLLLFFEIFRGSNLI
jgi:hypothetical protein